MSALTLPVAHFAAHFPALFGLHLAQYVWGGVLVWRQGSRAIPFAFALGTLFLYTFFTPCLLWLRQEGSIAGLDYSSQLAETLGVYMLGVGVFIAGWWALPTHKKKRWYAPQLQGVAWGPVSVLILVFWAGCMWGIAQEGVPLTEWYTYSNSNKYLDLFGKHWHTPLVDKLADGLVTLGYLLLLVRPRAGAILAVVLVVFFALLGFRYRILLLVGAGLVYLFWTTPPGTKRALLWVWVGLGCLGMAWLTLNRIRFSQRLFNKLDHNLAHFDPRLLANETNNSQTFGVVLGYYHAHNLPPDGCLATPTFVLVRALPARLFAGGKKPLAPLLTHVRNAYAGTAAGKKLHPALSNLEEYYLGFGPLGVAGGMLALAWLCHWLAGLGPVGGPLGTVFLFQLLSRGYLPQQVDLAVFLALPLVLLYIWQRFGPQSAAHKNSYS